MSLKKLPEPPAIPDLRTIQDVLIPILIVYEFVNNFKNRTALEEIKSFIEDYNEKVKIENGKRPYKQGGSSSVDLVLDLAKEELKKLYALLLITDLTDNTQRGTFSEQVVTHLNGKGGLASTMNRFAFCQRFLEKIFPDYYEFTYTLMAESGKPYDNISDFIDSKEAIRDCTVYSPNDWKPLKQRPSFGNIAAEDHCCAFYQNDLGEAVEAPVKLSWTAGRKKLVKVTLTQLEGFFADKDRRRPLHFVSETIYQAPNGPIFVTLRAENQRIPAYLQITIEGEASNDQRMGTYTTIGRRTQPNQPTESVSISGMFRLVNLLNETATVDVGLVNKIRYAQQNRLLLYSDTIQERLHVSRKKWTSFVGKYICSYIRLAQANLQTSYIELFEDGRATLKQKGRDEVTGWGRITTNLDGRQNLWLLFGNNAELGQARVRFLLNITSDKNVLKGIFSSETLITQHIAGGRMLMRRQDPAPELWPPDDHQDKSYELVGYSDLTDRDDLAFFTGQAIKTPTDDLLKNITDGPYWAEIARRLTYPTAKTTLDTFFGDGEKSSEQTSTTDPDLPYPDGDFYYYNFKQEEDTKLFFIERNFLRFKKDGTVTIKSGDSEYKGHAYYSHKTLKLSFLDGERGFLDVYFDMSRDEVSDTSKIKVLYGASLWRAGKRIQAKTVVLSRIKDKDVDFDQSTKIIKFLEANDPRFDEETKKLIEEEVNSGGVISYLRGERNRFHLSTINAPATGLRPRDNRSRALHYLVAKYYGLCLQALKNVPPLKSHIGSETEEIMLLHETKENLFQAYIYGYGCSFAGLKLTIKQALNVPIERIDNPATHIAQEYKKRFQESNLKDPRIKDVLIRIKEGAREQVDLQADFAEDGLFDEPELIQLGRRFWPDLMPPDRESNSTTSETPQSENSDSF